MPTYCLHCIHRCDTWYECGDATIAGPEECDGYVPGPSGDCCVACRSVPCEEGFVSFTQGSASVAEGASTSLTITRTGHTRRRVTLTVMTGPVGLGRWIDADVAEAGAIPAPATPGTDYVPISSQTVVLDDGDGEATVIVTAQSDVVGEEGDEAFLVYISEIQPEAGTAGALFGNWSSAVVTITDMPTAPAWSFLPEAVSIAAGSPLSAWPGFDVVLVEGSSVEVTLTRGAGSLPPMNVTVAAAASAAPGPSAAGANDWTLPPTVIFGKGQTVATVAIGARVDDLYEAAESFRVAFIIASTPGAPFGGVGDELGALEFVVPANQAPEFWFERREVWVEEGGVAAATVKRGTTFNTPAQVKYW